MREREGGRGKEGVVCVCVCVVVVCGCGVCVCVSVCVPPSCVLCGRQARGRQCAGAGWQNDRHASRFAVVG